MRKTAFTLAEVLITLGIIGVVAAMTLPNLIGDYKKNVQKNQFKKTYSILSQAYKRTEGDLGYTIECYYKDQGGGLSVVGDCRLLHAEAMKNFNVIKYCPDNGLANGCLPDYAGFDTIKKKANPDLTDDELATAIAGCEGWNKSNIITRMPSYVLSDGQIVFHYNGNAPIVNIDINGKKGPNKWGYDVFNFYIYGNPQKGIYFGNRGGCSPTEFGGMTSGQMLQSIYK